MKKRRLFRSVSYPGTVIDLASAVKEDYFSRLKTSRRQHLRRDLKLSSQRIDVHVEVVQRPDTSTLDELFALFMQTFIHAEIKFEQLNRQFFELISEQPVSYFILLRDGDSNRVVAFNLCFLMDTHVINKFIGIDRILPKNFLLLVRLWDTVLDWSLAHGAKTIQSGQTGYSTKIKTGHRLVPLNNYGQVFNVVFHALFRFVGERITWTNLDADLATAIAADPGIGIKTREAKDHVDVSEGGQTRKGNVEAGSRESSK